MKPLPYWKIRRDENLRHKAPFPTRADTAFYSEKTLPAWALRAREDQARRLRNTSFAPRPDSFIQAAINSHVWNATRKSANEHEPGNAMACLRIERRLGKQSLILYIQKASIEYARIQPKRVATYQRFLRRWYKANTRGAGKQHWPKIEFVKLPRPSQRLLSESV